MPLSAVETLQSTDLRHMCFASTSPSNTVPQGGPGSRCCLPATTSPPTTMGWGPCASFHTAIFYPTCTEGTRNLCNIHQVLRGVTALALPCLYRGLLSVLKYWTLAGGLSLCTPCACLHQCILSAGGLLFWFGSLFHSLGRGLSNDRVGWGDRGSGPYFSTILQNNKNASMNQLVHKDTPVTHDNEV